MMARLFLLAFLSVTADLAVDTAGWVAKRLPRLDPGLRRRWQLRRAKPRRALL